MDRELLLLALVLLGGGPLLWVCAALPSPQKEDAYNSPSETTAWKELWLPSVPLALLLAALIGWTAREPREAEALVDARLVLAVPTVVVWTRALARGAALSGRMDPVLAGAIGLFRPRIVVDASLERLLDPDAYTAVLRHEAAHARHRDPLRIWIAQFLADLAWPIPGARHRLERWLQALEIARDDDAVLDGADPSALAHAILVCAQRGSRQSRAVAPIQGSSVGLERRIRRLLDERVVRRRHSRRVSGVHVVAFSLAALVAGVVGSTYGEPVVRGLTSGW